MKVFKILIKEQKVENKWNYEDNSGVRTGKVAFDFKNDEMELKKGDTVWFQDDYARKVLLKEEEYISTDPNKIICQE